MESSSSKLLSKISNVLNNKEGGGTLASRRGGGGGETVKPTEPRARKRSILLDDDLSGDLEAFLNKKDSSSSSEDDKSRTKKERMVVTKAKDTRGSALPVEKEASKKVANETPSNSMKPTFLPASPPIQRRSRLRKSSSSSEEADPKVNSPKRQGIKGEVPPSPMTPTATTAPTTPKDDTIQSSLTSLSTDTDDNSMRSDQEAIQLNKTEDITEHDTSAPSKNVIIAPPSVSQSPDIKLHKAVPESTPSIPNTISAILSSNESEELNEMQEDVTIADRLTTAIQHNTQHTNISDSQEDHIESPATDTRLRTESTSNPSTHIPPKPVTSASAVNVDIPKPGAPKPEKTRPAISIIPPPRTVSIRAHPEDANGNSVPAPSTPMSETPDSSLKKQRDFSPSASVELNPKQAPDRVVGVKSSRPNSVIASTRPISGVNKQASYKRPAATDKLRSAPTQDKRKAKEEVQPNPSAVQALNPDLATFLQMIKGAKTEAKSDLVDQPKQDPVITDLKKTIEDLQMQLEQTDLQNQSLRTDLALQNEQHILEKATHERTQEELNLLKSDNELMQSRLQEATTTTYRTRIFTGVSGIAAEITSKEDLEKIEREIKEQETIIHGYQKENERLLKEVKDLSVKYKEAETRWFKEAQRLRAELTTTTESYERKLTLLKSQNGLSQATARLHQMEEEKQKTLLEHQSRERELRNEISILQRNIKEQQEAKLEKTHSVSNRAAIEQLATSTAAQQALQEKIAWYTEMQAQKERMIAEQQQTIELLTKEKKKGQIFTTAQFEHLQDTVQKLQKERIEAEAAHDNAIRQLQQENERTKAAYEKKLLALQKKPNVQISRVKELELQLDNLRSFYRNKIKKLEAGQLPNNANHAHHQHQELDKLKLIIQQKEDELQSCSAKMTQMEQDMNLRKQEWQLQRDNLQLHVQELQTQLADTRNTFAKLESQHHQAMKDAGPDAVSITELQVQIVMYKEQLKSLQLQLQTSEKARHELQENTFTLFKQAHVEALENLKQMKSMQGKELQGIILEHQKDLEKQKTLQDLKAAALSQQHDFILQLQKQLEESQQSVTKLKAKLNDLETCSTQVDNEKARVLHLQRALQSSQALVGQLKEQISILEIELEHTETRKDVAQQLQFDLKCSIEENARLRDRVTMLEVQLQDAPKPPGRNNFILLETKFADLEHRNSKRQIEQEAAIDKLKAQLQEQQLRFQQILENKNAEIQKFRTELDDILDAMVEFSGAKNDFTRKQNNLSKITCNSEVQDLQ